MKKLSLIICVLCIGIFLYSCKKESKSVNTNNKITYQNLNFKNQATNLNNLKVDEGGGTIVEWDEWGRKKKQCKGWGLCNAVWFPKKDTNRVSNYSASLNFDPLTGTYYIDILLSEPMPSPIPEELLNIPIDENFTIFTKEVVGRDLIFETGIYQFNESLDEFGGYRIYLK
ncbi:MAG: hypothetical protein WCO13_03840 [Bacteroidota bacterium]